MRDRPNLLVRLVCALGCVVAATFARLLLNPYLGERSPYFTFLAATAGAAWLGGLGPGLAAMVLGAGLASYFFVPPRGTIFPASEFARVALVLYLATGLIIVLLAEAQRAATRRAERSEDDALERQAQLEREFAERERSEERFRLAAEAVNGLIYEYDPATGQVERTRGLFEILGYRPEEVPPTTGWWYDLVHPDDLEALKAGTARALEAGDRYEVEYRARHRQGHYIHLLDRAVAGRDADGRIVRMVGCNQDISEARHAEAALIEADRRKDEFLAILAHELRNPLAPIRYGLHLLRTSAGLDADLSSELAMVDRQVAHIARLVDDLIDVARIGQGKVEFRKQVVDLAPVVRRAVEAIRPILEEQKQELVLSLPDRPVRLEADPTRLDQILSNLLNNAVKYTGPGGRVGLTIDQPDNSVIVKVSDTGIGIAPEVLPRIFGMFVRAEERAGPRPDGLGIGLGLVKALVELHDGSISARSEGLGAGSEFVVKLPAIHGPAEVEPEPEGPARPPIRSAPSRRRVLVVDDNEDAARSLARILERLHGQDVQIANDGPTALELAEGSRFDLILLDLGMPGMDGFEVARRLRAFPDGAHPTIVALTGWGQDLDRRRTTEAGFDAHFVKPIDPEILLDLLLAR